jgi:hypothetical protein
VGCSLLLGWCGVGVVDGLESVTNKLEELGGSLAVWSIQKYDYVCNISLQGRRHDDVFMCECLKQRNDLVAEDIVLWSNAKSIINLVDELAYASQTAFISKDLDGLLPDGKVCVDEAESLLEKLFKYWSGE